MKEGRTGPNKEPTPAPGVDSVGGERLVRSAELFGGERQVVIEHEGERYRLQCTSKGKLILTK